MNVLKVLYLFHIPFPTVLFLEIMWWRNCIAENNSALLSEFLSNTNIFEEPSLTFTLDDRITLGAHDSLLTDTDDFRTLRLHGNVFVDKSELINEYLARGGIVLLITKPRKWGKSININMFKRFFEIEVDSKGFPLSKENRVNRVLFTGGNVQLEGGRVQKLKSLKVTQYEVAMDHQGKKPVILLSFKGVEGNSYQEFEDALADRIMHLYTLYPFLGQYIINKTHTSLNENINNNKRKIFDIINLEDSLYFLSKLLSQHFKENVYIFIDDYETPIANAYLGFGVNGKAFEKVSELTYKIIKKAFKDNWHLERGILTGTYHFGWLNEKINLHNVRHSTIIDTTFSMFYGFTKEEVDKILEKLPTRINSEKMKEWYNGYTFDEGMIYNPWSTISCISNGGKFDYYWGLNLTTTSGLMDKLYMLDAVQEYLHQLLQGKTVIRKNMHQPIKLTKIEDTFCRVLLSGGFLNAVSTIFEPHCYTHPWNLSIPNREVRDTLAGGVAKWVASKVNSTLANYLNVTSLLTSLQIDYFREMFEKYLSNISLPKTASEQQHLYHLLVSGLFSSLATHYMIESSRKPGQRSREYILIAYPDLGKDALIIAYEIIEGKKKLLSAVEVGFKKLISKQYNDKIKVNNHIQHLVMIYMAISKRKVALKYQVTDVG